MELGHRAALATLAATVAIAMLLGGRGPGLFGDEGVPGPGDISLVQSGLGDSGAADGTSPEVAADTLPRRAPRPLRGGQVLIEHCASSQCLGTYEDVASILRARAAIKLEVLAAEYPPPEGTRTAARLVFAAQLGAFALIAFGDAIASAAGAPLPRALVDSARELKFFAFMTVWFAGNQLQSGMLSTGAFEVWLGDGDGGDSKLVWSSLKEDRLPDMADLLHAFGSAGVELAQQHSPSASVSR